MSRKQKPSRRPSKFENLTDEVIAQRWLALKPKAIKGTALFLTVMVASALVLFFGYPASFGRHPHQVAFLSLEYVLTMVFQISCVFSGCAAFITLMCLLYGRTPKKQVAG